MTQLCIRNMFGSSSSSRPLPTVSIVGSAGRRGDGNKMSKTLFKRMVEKAKEIITKDFELDLDKIQLVSGGAAWSDHIAVVLYMLGEVGSLTLHLPVKWDQTKYHDNANKDIWKNPGRSANKLHKQFSQKLDEDTLEQIDNAIIMGARYFVHDGFQKRNTEVAKSNYLIAFTWGDCFEQQKKGGTLDTWTKCTGKKMHIPLHSLNMQQSVRDCGGLGDKQIPSVPDVSHSVPLIRPRKRELDIDSVDSECDGVRKESKKIKL